MNVKKNNKLVLFTTKDHKVHLDVNINKETVWLTRQQMALLFDRDIKTIGKHINNALKEELDQSTVAKFATVQTEGTRNVERVIEHYNLDVIISVGYRVKSQRGVEFRRWATSVLKEYIMKGYAVNQTRLDQLNQAVRILKRVDDQLDAKQILSVVEQYTNALSLLDDYDHQCIRKPSGRNAVYVLNYEECRKIIDEMDFGKESSLFGREKDDSFRGSIGNIYQTCAGKDVYPTAEEKAANLLYFITKNHSFLDGNKRIAAVIFLYFLEKNGMLFRDGMKQIEDHTLVAVIVMIAESNPEEKETMVNLVMNFLSED